MDAEAPAPRAIAFFDGQNLYHAARAAFGYTHPNYDPCALARAVCVRNGWALKAVRFYTGVPERADNPFWHDYWISRIAAMGRQGIVVYSRRLRYRSRTSRLPDGREQVFLEGEEKGVDIRIALDVIRLAHARIFDVAILFSQDQDLTEVADEIRTIAAEQGRWIKLACAYPLSPTSRNRRGIDRTDWVPIDRDLYERCLDARDYRAKK